jgi:hypothetical protein
MLKRISQASPHLKARIAGVFYLLIFIAAPDGASSATAAKMIVTLICDTAVALIFYDLFKPLSQKFSFLAAFFRLIFVVVMAITTMNYLGPFEIMKGWHSATAFNTGYNIALIFFGLHCFLLGYLIFKSTFLPRILGALLEIAGFSYLINSFASFLAPAFADAWVYYFIAPWLLAEGSLTLWLLIFGVNFKATVCTGAKTGAIAVTTTGGSGSKSKFTVN